MVDCFVFVILVDHSFWLIAVVVLLLLLYSQLWLLLLLLLLGVETTTNNEEPSRPVLTMGNRTEPTMRSGGAKQSRQTTMSRADQQ